MCIVFGVRACAFVYVLSVRVYVPLALIVYENVFVWFPFATLPLTFKQQSLALRSPPV